MIKHFLPFHKTGWFYLLLALWGVCYWLVNEGGFSRLEKFNREQLHNFIAPQHGTKNVIHLEAFLSSLQFENIKKLLQQSSNTPIFIIGKPSSNFIHLLQSYLMNNPRKGSVVISTHATSSGAMVEESNNNNLVDFSANWLRNMNQSNIHWRTSSNIIYAPLIRNKNGSIPLVWHAKGKVYLTFVGEMLRQINPNNNIKLNASLNLMLSTSQNQWPIGVNGNIYESVSTGFSKSIPEAIANHQKQNSIKPALIIISDSSNTHANQVANIAQNLIANNYYYQSFGVKLTQWLSLICGLLIIWLVQKLKARYQGLVVLIYIIVLLVTQYLFLTQMQWFEVGATAALLSITWIVLLAFQKENRFLLKLGERHNDLLGKALPVFYQSQKFEDIRPLLEETSPNLRLVKTVFDVALQAEAKNNRALSKKLLAWIEASGIKHVDSQNKLNEIRAQVAKEELSEAGLDQTMVIGGDSKMATINPLANIKSFGRYQVEGILGKGAMGIVYRGVDPKISRHVAIKTLHLHDGMGSNNDNENLAESKDRFFREAETAGNLSHANIVTIYDVGEEGDLGYIAMDLLTGAPLSEFIKPENNLPTALIYQLMIQITDALEYAHKQNVVHRDIKPANIIYDDELQRVTVTDFGIAYVSDNSKTRTGVIMGSPYYMSPEQVLGQQVDGRSDIFSLGVTLYQLLCGYLPFEGESMASVVYQITNSKHASVKKWNAKLPSSATRITNKAMHKDIEKRYQTMQEFKQALINALKRDFKKDPIA